MRGVIVEDLCALPQTTNFLVPFLSLFQNSKFKIQIYLLYRDFLFYRKLPLTEEISSKSPSRF
jgi:hypothetical protein